MNPTGAVIVTFHNQIPEISACLRSLRDNSISQLVVVDNDPHQEMKVLALKNSAIYLPQRQNCGFATAADLGARQLSSDYLFFINPDARLLPGAISLAANFLTAQPAVGLVGLLMQAADGRPELASFGPPVTPLSLLVRPLQQPDAPREATTVGWVSGGALLIRRPLYQELNGFDHRFFLYWEDVDLCRRAYELGSRCIILPAARVIHRRGGSLSDPRQRRLYYDESADKYFRKHYPKTAWLPRFLRYPYRYFYPLPR